MSNTRHATEGVHFRQERFASAEAYKTALSAMLVAKRCALLRSNDPELAELIWFIQEWSQPDPFQVGWRLGSITDVADALLIQAGYAPSEAVFLEDWGSSTSEFCERALSDEDKAADLERTRSDLAAALCELALSPRRPAEALPGLGTSWRHVIIASREKCRAIARERLAPTSVAKRVAAALKFTSETGKPALVTGVAKLGKSAATKAFCTASGGLAKYVLTPEDTDMMSLYRAIAKALGVADGLTRKSVDVREAVERTLASSRHMLVFDEAHNLFCGAMRVTRQPQRILWIRRLIDSGVPVAFVGLPDFSVRISRLVEQIGWDASQIVDLIAKADELPRELASDDFAILVERLAANLPAEVKKVIASTANSQRGAQYAIDVIDVAKHVAAKAGRTLPTVADVNAAIGMRPSFGITTAAPTKIKHAARTPARLAPVPALAATIGLPAAVAQRDCSAFAVGAQ